MVARTTALVALACVALVAGDTYLHNPRGSNNRLNEKSANRNNGNRMFDSQNNNRGGYNKGDRQSNAAFDSNEEAYDFAYYMSTAPAYYNGAEEGKSILTVEWTHQHGCGGNEHDDPHKLNCNINIQYMCEPDQDVFPSVTDTPREDCINSCQIPDPANPNCDPAKKPLCRDSHIKTKADCDKAGYQWAASVFNDALNCPHECDGGNGAASKALCTGTWTSDHHTDPSACGDATKPCLYFRDGLTTARQEFTQGGNAETQATRLTRRNSNVRSERGLHEPWEWYDECSQRHRNRGLFTADQNLRGNTAIYTRQNPNNNRRGYECPEERDYWPYWHDSPWKDVVIMTDRLDLCPFFQKESQNVRTKNQCRNTAECPQCIRYNNEKECTERKGAWVTIASHNIPQPECIQAPWSRVNHLGNGRDGQAVSYNWTLPFVPKTGANLGTALESLEGMPSRCVMRLRYNISTDDYDVWKVNSTFNNNNGGGIDSPVRQNPEVDIGAKTTALRLAINTNQFGRTFQDRSHAFLLRPRPAHLGTRTVYNLNVRGKRGNIVQTFPSVEYDFMPNHLEISEEDFVHIQWAGSNTHNNGNPAGDGQAGDAGEGTGGTDRHNFVQVLHRGMGESFPATWEENTMIKQALEIFDANPDTATVTTAKDSAGDKRYNWGLRLATAGYYPETVGGEQLNNLLNNAVPSYMGAVIRFAKGEYNAMCTRNHNFSNRDQKSFIKVTGKSGKISGTISSSGGV